MAQNTPTSMLNFANPVRLGTDRRQMAGNTFLSQLCKFIATCLAEKVKNSAEDWQNNTISRRTNTKWWTVELYKKKHVALLIIAKLLATTTAIATRTLQICILNNEKRWIFVHIFIGVLFAVVLFLSTTWNVPFFSCVDDSFFSAVSGICLFSWKTEIESSFPILISGASGIASVSDLAH